MKLQCFNVQSGGPGTPGGARGSQRWPPEKHPEADCSGDGGMRKWGLLNDDVLAKEARGWGRSQPTCKRLLLEFKNVSSRT